MDIKNRHPLNAINGYESLSMLEVLIPFVEYPLKLPLALFIKFYEIKLIISNFCSIENLSRLGLHNVNNNPMDMVCALTGISPDMLKMLFTIMGNTENPTSSSLLKNLSRFSSEESCHKNPNLSDFSNTECSGIDFSSMNFSGMDFSNLANLFQTIQTGFGSDANSTNHSDSSSAIQQNNKASHSSDHFEENLQSILAEYDLQQAEAFNTYTNDTSTTSPETQSVNTDSFSAEYNNPEYDNMSDYSSTVHDC